MQCPKCGWQNPDDAVKCNNCFTDLAPTTPQQPQPTQQMPPQAPQQIPQQQPYAQPSQQPYAQQPYAQQPYGQQPAGQGWVVPDYMVWSIVITIVSLLCCCYLPVPVVFAIVAIVKSSQANSKKMVGDIVGAMRDANAAKTWLYWAAGLDAAGLVVAIITLIIMAAGNHGTQ